MFVQQRSFRPIVQGFRGTTILPVLYCCHVEYNSIFLSIPRVFCDITSARSCGVEEKKGKRAEKKRLELSHEVAIYQVLNPVSLGLQQPRCRTRKILYYLSYLVFRKHIVAFNVGIMETVVYKLAAVIFYSEMLGILWHIDGKKIKRNVCWNFV